MTTISVVDYGVGNLASLANMIRKVGGAATWVAMDSIYPVELADRMHRRIVNREKARWYITDLLVPTAAALAGALLCSEVSGTPQSARSDFAGVAPSGLVTAACSVPPHLWSVPGSHS